MNLPYVDRDEIYTHPAVRSPTCHTSTWISRSPSRWESAYTALTERIARISAKGGAYVVSGDLGEIRTNLWEPSFPGTVDQIPVVSSCSQFLGLPFISRKPTGEWVYSYLDYRLETATYERIHGYIDIGKPFVPSKQSSSTDLSSKDYSSKDYDDNSEAEKVTSFDSPAQWAPQHASN